MDRPGAGQAGPAKSPAPKPSIELSWQCPFCAEQFTDSRALARHVRVEADELVARRERELDRQREVRERKTAAVRRWQSENREQYNAYMREYMREYQRRKRAEDPEWRARLNQSRNQYRKRRYADDPEYRARELERKRNLPSYGNRRPARPDGVPEDFVYDTRTKEWRAARKRRSLIDLAREAAGLPLLIPPS